MRIPRHLGRAATWALAIAGLVACGGGGGGGGGPDPITQGSVTVVRLGDDAGEVRSAPAGIACGADCVATFPLGTTITLTAIPDDDALFQGWGGACSGEDPVCALTVTASTEVTATFIEGDPIPDSGSAEIDVDPNLAPPVASLPDEDGRERPVARMQSASGVATDFLLGEIVVATDDPIALAPLLARWSGTVIETVAGFEGVPALHRVLLDTSGADVAALLETAAFGLPDLDLDLNVSSPEAAQLLAVVIVEARALGLSVLPNFVLQGDSILTGSTTEAPTGGAGYVPDACAWPYMNRGSAQDIGVCAAWQALERTRRLDRRVGILVLDGGFAPNLDFPDESDVYRPNVPNSSSCGGSPCPWHGTNVVSALMGQVDDGYGGAGPAGPVARLTAVHQGGDFFETLGSIGRTIGALGSDVKIINISAGFELDVGWDVATKILCFGLCPSPTEIADAVASAITAGGRLIFASAGNEGRDVDNGGGIEGSTHIPCELTTVICVGGLEVNATSRASGSNFGSRTSGGTVDIYAPYRVWVGPTPAAPANAASLISGTSFSSPFVAGVAALVWAADPTLAPSEVWAILQRTAHVGGVGGTGIQRRVNAYAAVAEVVGGAPPTVTVNALPSAPLGRTTVVTATAFDAEYGVDPCPPLYCALEFSPTPESVSGGAATFRFTTPGPQTITVTVRDAVGQTGVGTATIDVVNSPPEVAISQPEDGASIPQGVPVQFLGSATDVNEGPDPGPGPLACAWTSSVATDVGLPTTCAGTFTFASSGPRRITLRAADAQGIIRSDSVDVVVTAPPANLPPVITLGAVPPLNYDQGYAWDVTFPLSASAVDPEGNTPVTFEWRATSFVEGGGTSTVYASDVVLGAAPSVAWLPSTTPALFIPNCGSAGAYNGQVVRVRVIATDALGNSATASLPDVKIYRCILV